jgi:papain like cysteine protease AvrRpt2
MPKLKDFPTAIQERPNSCWACATRMIINYYDNAQTYGSDQALANAWNTAKQGRGYNNIDIQQSASGALMDLGYKNNADDQAIPTKGEIRDAINDHKPLLAIVGTTALASGEARNLAAQQGHWVVIIGISDDQSTIDVFDPSDGNVRPFAYNSRTYKTDQYWQNTSYVDKKNSLT